MKELPTQVVNGGSLEIAHNSSQMKRYAKSDFKADAEVFQRNIKLEGLFGNRGMMIEDTNLEVRNLMRYAEMILRSLEQELSH